MMSATSFAQSLQSFFQTNVLLGGAGVGADADLDTIMINPAQLGQLPHSGVQLGWGFHNQEYQQRYPGFPAHSSAESGLEAFPTPSFAYKVNKKFGVTGFAVPFPLQVDIEKRGLPLIILSQQNKIDLVGKAQTKGILVAGLGYSFSPAFSIGASVSFLAFDGTFSVLESSAGGELLNGQIAGQNFTAGIGIKSKISKKVGFGIFAQAFKSTLMDLQVIGGSLAGIQDSIGGNNTQSPGAPSEAAPPAIGGKDQSTTFANPIRLGLSVAITAKIKLLGDVEYERKTVGKAFSITDLVEKPKDTYDTLSVFFGADIDLPRQRKMYVGYKNMPSAIGAGTPGKEGKTGFGFISLLDNLGGAPSRPIWAISAGYRQYFGKRLRKGKNAPKNMYGEVGFIYEEVSIGIDDTGEQPGAYLVRDMRIPFKFGYKF